MSPWMAFPLILCSLAWALCLFGSQRALRRTSPRRGGSAPVPPPEPLSCLKPLKGVDPGLEDNLRTFFTQDDPAFELVFCAADAGDPALPLVRKLMAEFSGVRARIVLGGTADWENPKVANLAPAYAAARHDLILVSDSNVRVPPGYFEELRSEFRGDVGLLTAVVAGSGAEGLGGALEEVFLNTFYFRGMFVADAFGHPCVVGKCMLFRRSELDRVGGFRNFRRYLAEDFMAGIAMEKLGKRVAYARSPLRQHIGFADFRRFWSRHLRWGRLRKSHAPLPFLLEPFLTSIGAGLLGAWACASHVPWQTFLSAHFLAWFSCDLLLAVRARGAEGFRARDVLRIPAAWATREALHFFLWLAILSGSEVEWRGKRLRVANGGLLAPPRADAGEVMVKMTV